MPGRSTYLTGIALAAVALSPTLASADVHIEERATALNSNVTRWISIKGDKRAIVTRADLEVGGVLYNAGAKHGAYVEIARPDQELIWEIDPQERSYKVMKADQFSRLLQKGVQAPRNPNEQPLRTLYRSETTAIEVVPTGKTKRIAGYQAEEVRARVVVGAQNLISGKQLNFTFDQEVWITKDAQLVKETRDFEQAYVEAFGSAASLSQAQLVAGEWSDAFVTHLRAMNDRVRALGGFTLACTTTVTEEAIAQTKGEKNGTRSFVVASTEVRKITTSSVADTEFELPEGYIDSDTKVAVAPRGPSTMVAAAAPVEMPAAVEKPAVEKPAVVAKAPEAPVPAPPPAVVAKAPETPLPVKPVVVAKTPEAPAPPVVVAKAPEAPAPEAPAAVKPTVVAKAPEPTFPVARPGGPPTNVVVPGVNGPRLSGTVTPVLVQGYTPQVVANNYPVLQGLGSGPQPAGGGTVTVDEPEYLEGKKKRKRK